MFCWTGDMLHPVNIPQLRRNTPKKRKKSYNHGREVGVLSDRSAMCLVLNFNLVMDDLRVWWGSNKQKKQPKYAWLLEDQHRERSRCQESKVRLGAEQINSHSFLAPQQLNTKDQEMNIYHRLDCAPFNQIQKFRTIFLSIWKAGSICSVLGYLSQINRRLLSFTSTILVALSPSAVLALWRGIGIRCWYIT